MRKRHTDRIIRSLRVVLLSTIGLLAACRPQARQEPGLQALADDFRAANQAANYQPMLRLYYTEGCDERSVRRLKLALEYELGLPIKRIDFESLAGAPEETIDFIHAGIHYGPSLKPRYRMRVVYSVEDHFTSLFTIGKSTSGDWHIICAKPEPEPAD